MGQLSYIASSGLSRVSTAFFIGQLTRHPPQVRVSYVLAGIAGGWAMVSTLLVALRGEVSRPWAVLDGTQMLVCRNLFLNPNVWVSDLPAVPPMGGSRGFRVCCRDHALVAFRLTRLGSSNEAAETNIDPCRVWLSSLVCKCSTPL